MCRLYITSTGSRYRIVLDDSDTYSCYQVDACMYFKANCRSGSGSKGFKIRSHEMMKPNLIWEFQIRQKSFLKGYFGIFLVHHSSVLRLPPLRFHCVGVCTD
jgi:hypothetical protein